MKRASALLSIVLLGSVAFALGFTSPASAATPKKPVILVYGDSLTYESAKFITKNIDGHVWSRHVFAAALTAPCDWLLRLPADIKRYRPSRVVFVSVGNAATNCMRDSNGDLLPLNSPGYLAKYAADIDAFFAYGSATTKAIFAEGAPMFDENWNTAVSSVYQIAQAEAAKPQFTNVATSRSANLSVSNNGAYTWLLPCNAAELKSKHDGCLGGQIDVRTEVHNPVLDQYGIHLCPVGISSDPKHVCVTMVNGKIKTLYSAGEVRYGAGIANAALS